MKNQWCDKPRNEFQAQEKVRHVPETERRHVHEMLTSACSNSNNMDSEAKNFGCESQFH